MNSSLVYLYYNISRRITHQIFSKFDKKISPCKAFGNFSSMQVSKTRLSCANLLGNARNIPFNYGQQKGHGQIQAF